MVRYDRRRTVARDLHVRPTASGSAPPPLHRARPAESGSRPRLGGRTGAAPGPGIHSANASERGPVPRSCLRVSSDARPRLSPLDVRAPIVLIVPFRWVIGLLLFASTVINYIDRQTLSVLAPKIMAEFHWSNTDFAYVVIAFRAA